jgi:ribosomal protein S18 acetylase RimI-like enzyme
LTPDLRFNVLQDPDEFADRVGDFLAVHEAEHSLLFGILSNLSSGWAYGAASGGGPVLALVEDDAGIGVVGVCTPPRNIVISRAATVGAVGALAGGLSRLRLPLPGVSGPAAESRLFAASWARLHAEPFRRAMALQVYQAHEIRPPPHPAPGCLRAGGPADTALIAGWIADFNDEALAEGVSDRSAALRMAQDLVSDHGRRVYLWENTEPVSMAATGRPSPNGGRVYAVYTPPEHRRMGYASSSVAALSRSMLEGGLRSCFLFADVTNPTPNHIYRQIGYEPVAFFDDYRFGG